MYILKMFGEEYPLRHTLRGARKIGDIYKNKNVEEMTSGELAEINGKMLAVFAEEGAAFEKVFNGKEITPPTEEQILTYIHPSQKKEIAELVAAVLQKGLARTVEIAEDTNAGKVKQKNG